MISAAAALFGGLAAAFGVEPAAGPPEAAFLAFTRAQAAELRRSDAAMTDLESWKAGRAGLRQRFLDALGEFPATPCPLEPRVLGTVRYDGYRVERLLLQTLPGVRMTANAYVPESSGDKAAATGKLPAVLCVHGHWRLAKQEPVVQTRCIGLAKLGFFVLVVDAFGAGERAIGKALGEYHGEMAGALLFPSGWTLAGVQWYENSRAIDYLRSRPEVDGNRIGVTGASGGGNQSMYCGTLDERVAATIPVCSVGNYQAYLGAACCMCEVVPGALRFAEEGDLLGLAAPRALMVINATGDARQFSVAEARKSLARATSIFQHYGRGEAVRHTIIESGHDYNRPMREAMYGWVAKHLAGRGDGSPIPESELKTVDPETLRCFPGDSRPDDYVTLPRFAAAEARRALAALPPLPEPGNADAWHKTRKERVAALRERVLGGAAAMMAATTASRSGGPPVATISETGGRQRYRYGSEPGITLEALFQATSNATRTVMLVAARPPQETIDSPLARRFAAAGWHLYVPEMRGTGRTAVPNDQIGRAPDHNSAEWSLWIGRPLLGQWTVDIASAARALRQAAPPAAGRLTLVGIEQMGPVALAPWPAVC
jgi:dienelactone hydrolase